MPEMYGVEYPELVEDRDGKQMPYNPAAVGTGSGLHLSPEEWMKHFCICGHLLVDHHFDASLGEKLTEEPHRGQMPCWATECPCYLKISKGEMQAIFPRTQKPDKAIVVLLQVQATDDPYPGSTKLMADCGHECWISPSIAQDVAEMVPDRRLVLCMTCAVEDGFVSRHIAEHGTAMTERSARALEQEKGKPLEQIAQEAGYEINITELP